MSDNSSQLPTVQSNLSSGLQAWEGAELSAPPASTSPLERALAAIRRYKFLVIGVVLLGAAAGVAATHLVTPQYEVRATVWIQSETPLETKTGPIRSAELLNSDAWVELLKSYRVTDSVVREMALYLEPENPQDSPLFTKFSLAEKFVPGPYRLTIDPIESIGCWRRKSSPRRTVVRRRIPSDARSDSTGWCQPARSSGRQVARSISRCRSRVKSRSRFATVSTRS